jgi:hypothetical protein
MWLLSRYWRIRTRDYFGGWRLHHFCLSQPPQQAYGSACELGGQHCLLMVLGLLPGPRILALTLWSLRQSRGGSVSKVDKKPESYKRDQLSLKHLKEFFKKKRLNEIKPILVEHYKRKRIEDGRTPGTVNRELACLKHLFSIAVRDRETLSNPVITGFMI